MCNFCCQERIPSTKSWGNSPGVRCATANTAALTRTESGVGNLQIELDKAWEHINCIHMTKYCIGCKCALCAIVKHPEKCLSIFHVKFYLGQYLVLYYWHNCFLTNWLYILFATPFSSTCCETYRWEYELVQQSVWLAG